MKLKNRIITLVAFCILSFTTFAQNYSNPIVSEDVVFEEVDGVCAVEAEYFFKQSKSEIRQWYRTSKNEQANVGRDEDPAHCKDAGNNAYLEILPDTRVTSGDKLVAGINFSNEAGQMAVLHYKVKINNPGRYYVWGRAFSEGAEDNGLHVGMDGTWPATGQRLQWCEGKNNWRWESRQRTNEVHCGEQYLIYLDIEKAGIHEITFSMREDGFEFDRFLLTSSKDYIPQGIGPNVKLAAGKLPKPYPLVAENPKAKPTFLYAVETSARGLQLIKASQFSIEGTNFYSDSNGKWLAINPELHKKSTAKVVYNAKDGAFDILFLGVGENDGNSNYEIAINGKSVGAFQCPPSKNSFEEGVEFVGLFDNIKLKKGDEISVTSEIASNDGEEFSRARWGGIALVPAGQGTAALTAIGDAGSIANVGPMANKEKKPETDYPEISGELKKWHKVSLVFNGPETSEWAKENPFLDYKLEVLFSKGNKSYKVPGYFAADGNAGETSADEGNIWKVHFRPDEVGTWNYKVSFKKGKNIVVIDGEDLGESLNSDGLEGTIEIAESDKTGVDFRAKGRIVNGGKGYFKFQGTDEIWIKNGADSPENFLAYHEFDQTTRFTLKKVIREGEANPDDGLHKYETHVADWKDGNPIWKNGLGKGIIGALNYLHSAGVNSVYMLTMNIIGDGKDVWPYNDYNERYRFDCSKLDQWEVVFDYMEQLGIMNHFVLQETENECLLDMGHTGVQRKVYLRELVARFGHHLAVTYNLGEENGPAKWTPIGQTDEQKKAMANYIKTINPYSCNVVLHTHANDEHQDEYLEPMLAFENLDGPSMQVGNPNRVHERIKKWVDESEKAGDRWIVNLDEIGPAWKGAMPDSHDFTHDTIRHQCLWGTLLAGGAGVEWYFGYRYPHNDLGLEDFRSRSNWWKQSEIATRFVRQFPLEEMSSSDELVNIKDAFCLSNQKDIYLVYWPAGTQNGKLQINAQKALSVKWFNPREGGELQTGSVSSIEGSGNKNLGTPPANSEKDWVVVVQ